MEFISSMQESQIPQHCIMDYVSEMHGGPESVPVTAQDMYNLKKAKQRERNANDVAKLLSFFASCKKDNPQFFSDFQLDKEGKILSIFWSHASQQGDYIDFGDAVTFDTTHKTNLYEKPLGMFVGSNHHLHCTIFAFALLGDETVDTFEWVFNAFKTCMGTEGPRVMLTDQDPAMPVALERVFPHTIHRLCLWHVQNRYMPFLNELYARFEEMDFKTRFQSIIHHPLTELEFETAWSMLLEDFDLHDNSTLDKLYGIRKDWVPAFFKNHYCGLMLSTQRSESMNRLVKSAHVDANTPLHQFAKQMMKLLHSRKMKESKEAVGSMGQKETNTLYMFEIRVARAYTRAVMCRFQESLKYATAFKITHDEEGGANDWIDRIPKEYILQRYTTSARQDVPFSRDDRNLKGKDGETKSYRQKMLLKKAMKVVHHASLSKAGNDRALTVMDELLEVLSRLETDIDVEETCGTSGGDGIQDDDEANRDNEKDDEFDERNNKVWIVLLLMFICK
ncbi:protein FAR1-RELATED SEQUENCE 5-like [Zea mays]|uniref:protein FAR1-RELATED SEQUENCE 5-like n=1 Tax=Zea mays TaxID=4577 RepID=UPI0009AA25A7|nr:protein FAR1-RELATED SEQUENCE 5-like [Zea mays]|eukprot:XP_020399807.1 protein FAR1-RELATED SEQUENCE 5-like [Zea mays]